MTRSRKTIVFVHLLNDYSGSPLVLSHVIDSLPDDEYEKILYTSSSSKQGFLSGLDSVRTRHFWYRWKANPWLRLISFIVSQVLLFFQLLRFWRKDVVIYINTLLPFGAGMAGRLMGKKIIYHVHETSMKPPALKRILRFVANHTADEVIYVSHYLASEARLSRPLPWVIHNSLSPAFSATAAGAPAMRFKDRHRVLMLCSMKEYKGIEEFMTLAGMLPEIAFELVLNAAPVELKDWLKDRQIPSNLLVYPAQSDTHSFYQRATVVLNLSHPDKWLETFGMTILEAMSYGLPVIVPTEGGVRELVEEEVNGFLADYRELDKIAGHIRVLTGNPVLYRQFSDQAKIRSESFSAAAFRASILDTLTHLSVNTRKNGNSMKKKKIAVIGTVGIPAKYGGFETLAEHLARHMADEFQLYVYCTKKKYPKEQRQKTFLGARLIYLPFDANGIWSIVYDCLSILHAVFYADVLLVLGVSGGVMLPFVRRLTRKKIIVSIDGIEWKRDKWIRPAKWYLWWAEKTAVKYSHADISDNESIQDYTAFRYKTLSNIIEYGADHTLKIAPVQTDIDAYPFLARPYAFKVCRIEPENNIHIVLEAFARIDGLPLVMIGNWTNSEYGKKIREQYGNIDRIILLDPIYDQPKLDVIRGNAALYVHGHSAGGTNPSLVEAMYLALPVIAFNVSYNKTTTENKAWYFSSAEDIIRIVGNLTPEDLVAKAAQMKEIADRRYTWKVIARKYIFLVQQVLAIGKKSNVRSKTSNLRTEDLLNLEAGHLIHPSYFYEKR